MIKIRLQRIGRRNQPYYRVVVTDSQNGPKSGRFLEVLGSYNPKAGTVEIKKDRAEYWIANGAQTSGTVHNFFIDQGLVKGRKMNVLPKKSPTKKRNAPDEPESEPAASAPAEEVKSDEVKEETPSAEEAKNESEATVEEPTVESTEAADSTEEKPVEEKPAPEEAPNEEDKKEA